ncbi:transporter [Acidobacteria bacterium AH-259-G07]|nr:transporter [Acidobacteria bacterium AH-259-G07]
MDHKSKRPNVSSLFARVNICLLFPAIFTVTTGFAEEKPSPKPELVTDRPDQTESSVVVPPGYVQVETGWSFSRNDEGGIRSETHEFPGTLLRIGVVNRVELRLGSNGGIWEGTRLAGQKTDLGGVGDMEIGAKLYFWEEQGWIPETAFLAGVSLPVGKEELSSHRSDPAFRVSMSHTLSDRFSFGYNLGATWESELDETGDRDTLSFFNYTAVMGMGVSDRVGAFVEVFGDIPLNANGGPKNSLDGGLTYLLRDNLQLDAAVGVGISDDADNWFVGLGITVRFPR